MHSRGINAVNSAPSFKVTAWPKCATFAKRDTQEEEKKMYPRGRCVQPAAGWMENVVVNGTQVMKKQNEGRRRRTVNVRYFGVSATTPAAKKNRASLANETGRFV